MSHKRKHAEFSGGHHESRPFAKKQRAPTKPEFKKRGIRRPQTSDAESRVKANAINGLKGRIRDLKRLLEHVDNKPKHKMPATVRMERERELEACEHEVAEKLAATEAAERRGKMIGKYHKMRFFDRQKATRILKRLRRELDSSEDTGRRQQLVRKIHNAEVDVNYAMFYPLLKPYSALFPRTKRDKDVREEREGDQDAPTPRDESADGPKGDVEIWREVEGAMEEGGLEAIRNREESSVSASLKQNGRMQETKKTKEREKKGRPGPSSHGPKEAGGTEDENESDGGFFE